MCHVGACYYLGQVYYLVDLFFTTYDVSCSDVILSLYMFNTLVYLVTNVLGFFSNLQVFIYFSFFPAAMPFRFILEAGFYTPIIERVHNTWNLTTSLLLGEKIQNSFPIWELKYLQMTVLKY